MIKSKQITITAPTSTLNDFNDAIEKANETAQKKITKSGLFTNFMIKFINKNKSKND